MYTEWLRRARGVWRVGHLEIEDGLGARGTQAWFDRTSSERLFGDSGRTTMNCLVGRGRGAEERRDSPFGKLRAGSRRTIGMTSRRAECGCSARLRMCPLGRANVSSFWPHVSTFEGNVSSLARNVSTLTGHVSSAWPNVFSFWRRALPGFSRPRGGGYSSFGKLRTGFDRLRAGTWGSRNGYSWSAVGRGADGVASGVRAEAG